MQEHYNVRSQFVPMTWWRRLSAKLWPEDRNRPRVGFERYKDRHRRYWFNLKVRNYPRLDVRAFGWYVYADVSHGRNCNCDDCVPF